MILDLLAVLAFCVLNSEAGCPEDSVNCFPGPGDLIWVHFFNFPTVAEAKLRETRGSKEIRPISKRYQDLTSQQNNGNIGHLNYRD
jgi:hypothetical protein